jgi:putative FmdB family regulatory protein
MPEALRLEFRIRFPQRCTMPQYEFFCHGCNNLFAKPLTLAEYEAGEIVCPHCGSEEVEQSWSAFYAITSKKSA